MNRWTNSSNQFENEPFEEYAHLYDPDYQSGDQRPVKRKKTHRPDSRAVVASLTDEAEGLEAGFQITYRPSRYEAEWLLSSLRPFYDQRLIVDVEAQVKGGKEASVYRCVAHPSTGRDYVAAKVYRPRKFRNLRNDKLYREGRAILGPDGRKPKERDQRLQRALEKGTAFGAQMSHTSWLMYEFNTLNRLHRSGGAVPQPLGSGDNAILMEYFGDGHLAAPILQQVNLDGAEARALFNDVLNNIEMMLQFNMIHGDLSAFNILYWQGRAILIDFPQVVDSQENGHAHAILARDIERVSEYFQQQGVDCDPVAITDSLWRRYAFREPLDELAELSRYAEEEDAAEETADMEGDDNDWRDGGRRGALFQDER